jgi:hypothetical protein
VPGEAAIAPDRAALHVGGAGEQRARRGHVLRVLGQANVKREPEFFAPRRQLEQEVVGIGRRLPQLQIARPHFVRLRRGRQQRTRQ